MVENAVISEFSVLSAWAEVAINERARAAVRYLGSGVMGCSYGFVY